jgi:PAS domain S-box-containing protein
MANLHEDLIEELAEHFQPVLEHCPQGVYLWLDEGHKTCNERLAEMFGYTVPEWRAVPSSLGTFVAPEDQEAFSQHYYQTVYALAGPVTFAFRGVRKDGSTFLAETDMIPIVYRGHQVAYHFVREAESGD